MPKTVVSSIADRNAFFTLLQHNTGLIVIKLGAEWCGPCKKIQQQVHNFFALSPEDVMCCDIDVDESFDFYAFLKAKKMVNGIPVLLCYKKGNLTFIPDDSMTGTNMDELHGFFTRCGGHLATVKAQCL